MKSIKLKKRGDPIQLHRTFGGSMAKRHSCGCRKSTRCRENDRHKMALAKVYPDNTPTVLTPREPEHLEDIRSIDEDAGIATFFIDDLHRLDEDTNDGLAKLVKAVAERDNIAAVGGGRPSSPQSYLNN